MYKNYCTRIFTFILSLIHLQGCYTPYVIDKARGINPVSYGIESAWRGINTVSYRIESAWIDSKNQEFLLCLLDKTGFHKNKIDHFLIRIPKDIVNAGGNDYIDYDRRGVSKLSGETNWLGFSSYTDREDILVYDLNITVNNSCNSAPTNLKKLDVIEPSQKMDFKEALSFTGSLIDEKIKTYEPFAVFVADPVYDDTLSDSIYICEKSLKQPCLYLLSKSTNYSEGEVGRSINKSSLELLSVYRLVWESDKQPLWYIALPFSIAIDAAIVMTVILVTIWSGCRFCF